MTVTKAVKEAIWLRCLIENFNLHQDVIMVFCDTQSTRCIMRESNILMSGIISFENLKSSILRKFVLQIIQHM